MTRETQTDPQRRRARPAHAAQRPRRAPVAGSTALDPAIARDDRAQPRPRHLRTVDRRPRPRLQAGQLRLLVVLSVIVLGVAIAFALVYLHVVANQRQFGLDRLNQQVSLQQQRYDRLRLQVAQLDAPGRIISAAERQGMHEPASVTYLQAAGSTGSAPAAATSHRSQPVTAPAGDANWPAIKALLKGSP